MLMTGQQFREVVIRDGLTLVLFETQWCGICAMLGAIVERAGSQWPGQVDVGRLDVEREPEIAAAWGVADVPDVRLFCRGAVVAEIQGSFSQADIISMVQPQLP